jgi:virulence factor Mce-like protein
VLLGRPFRTRIAGGVLIAVLGGFLALTVVVYDKGFTASERVTLDVTNVGDQLTVPADVKLDGIVVGQVTRETATPTGAVAQLSMSPGDVSFIPENVTALILPKTLFGEKFVDLVIPADPSSRPMFDHEVITEASSKAALEVETVFDNLLPLLREVAPAQLNETLSAIATALAGQENSLGNNFTVADRYLTKLNVHLPAIDADLSGLADLAANYSAAAPDLVTTLANFSTNAQTTTATAGELSTFLSATEGFSTLGTSVLNTNADDLIELAKISTPGLALTERYSPEFSCLFGDLAALDPPLNSAFSSSGQDELHITLFDVPDRGAYSDPADLPTLNAPYTLPGPACYGGTDNTEKVNVGYPGPPCGAYPAGTQATYPAGSYPNRECGGGSSSATSRTAAVSPADLSGGDVGVVGSPTEQQAVASLLGPGVPKGQDGLLDLLMGPLLRGTGVSQ